MMDTRNTDLRVEVNDQLDFLLEYLQHYESHNLQEQDVESYSSISEESYQPLDLSMKKDPELDTIFSNSKSSSASNSNIEHLLTSNLDSPSSNSSHSESSQSDFDLNFLPTPGPRLPMVRKIIHF